MEGTMDRIYEPAITTNHHRAETILRRDFALQDVKHYTAVLDRLELRGATPNNSDHARVIAMRIQTKRDLAAELSRQLAASEEAAK